jgi:hypothetical protein
MFSGHLWLTSYTAKLRKRSGSCHQRGRRRRDCSSPLAPFLCCVRRQQFRIDPEVENQIHKRWVWECCFSSFRTPVNRGALLYCVRYSET